MHKLKYIYIGLRSIWYNVVTFTRYFALQYITIPVVWVELEQIKCITETIYMYIENSKLPHTCIV